ncbi:MAG: oligosaccharide flippase family protein [Chloroflexi bacterium]|nr:oligosaccharide flippase family protein [Chloroflexota bacterium]MCI0643989.1 oligosaccharide flippase family protein [Chloroflexota bacterium]MCI0732012.1 oligosaccharide flippase family protein [Chloroflexota bacterium]
MNRLKQYQAEFLILAGYLILPLLLFGNVTLGGRTMVPADNLFQWQPWAPAAADFNAAVPHNSLLSDLLLENYAWKQFLRNSLQNGEIPLWNPYLFAGTPFLATGQHSAYYPFTLLFLALPLAKAYGWYAVSQLWLAGALAYFFGRVLGLRRASAAVAGLVYQGCGFMLVSAAVFPMILGAAVWLPLLLACLEKIIRLTTQPNGGRGATLPWAALGAIALGGQVLAGHIEITYYTLLVMGAYAVWRIVSSVRYQVSSGVRPVAWLVGLIGVGLMLGGVQFIPFVEVGQANFREGAATLAEVRGWAFPPRRILTLAAPDFFGNPADHRYADVFTGRSAPFTTNFYGQTNPHGAYSSDWGIKNYVEGGIYLGILPLFLAALGLWSAGRWRERRGIIGFFALLAFFSLAFIFGTPLYALLYYGLPGINQLHSPFRWVFPFSLSLAVLAGYGMDILAESRAWRQEQGDRRVWPAPLARLQTLFTLQSRASAITILAGLAFWSGLGLLLGLFLSRAFYPALAPTVERLFLGLAQAPDAFPGARAFYSYEFRQLFILGLMLVAAGCVLRVSRCPIYLRRRPIWEFMAVVAIGLDLFVAGYGFHPAVDPDLLAYRPELVEWLAQQPGFWRLTTFAPHGDKPLNANTPWLYGFQDVRGYDSIILKQYTDYMATIEPQNELQYNRVQPVANWESLNSPLLDLLGVKYIITAETVELPKLRLAWEGEGLRVYENLAAMPRAYTLPAGSAMVVDDALAAMTSLDPRYVLLIEPADLPPDVGLPGPANAAPGAPVPADIVAYGNVEVVVNAAVGEPAWLVLNDTAFAGWRAFVRPAGAEESAERDAPLVRVNGNFRGVYLDPQALGLGPGLWTVRFRYSPLSFKLGGLASFMGGILVLFALAVWAWRRLYNPQGELTNIRSIAKNSLAPMALNLFNRAIDFAYAAFYLRLLGPADAGKFATAIIIAGWFEIVSNFGLNTLVIREVSKDRRQASRYLLNTGILRLGTALLGGLPVFVYLAGIRLAGNPLDDDTTLAVLLFMLGMILSGLGQGFSGLYYAYETAEFPAAVTTVTTILKVGFGVMALLLGYGFVGLAAVSILASAITLAILTVAAFRHFHLSGPWQVDFRLQRQMIGRSYPLMLNHFFAVIFFQVDVPLLRQFNGDAVVGWYNSAYKWINAFNVIPSFFTFALFPVISRQVVSSLPDARRTFRMAIKLLLLVAFPLAAVTMLLAPLLIGVLGGAEFLPHGAVALQLVVWSIPIGWMNSVTNYVLIALGVERRLTTAFILGVAFNVVANLIFLPRFSYLAASVITILSEVVLLALFTYYLRPAMPGVGWPALLKRPLAVTAGMVWAMWLGSQVHLALGLLLGLLVYPLGLWLLRVFGEEERRILQSLLPKRLAGRIKEVIQ